MKRFKLLLTVMMVVAIVALCVGCPNESSSDATPSQKVATPVINIGEGQDADNFDFSKPITFISPTEGVTFHYTTNGITIPTTESLSGASLTLPTDANNTYTVKVIGVKEGYANSDVAEKTFTKRLSKTDLVLVKAGSFDAGGGTTNHNVTLTKDFFMGVTEVTQKQYYDVMRAKPSSNAPTSGWENLPVERVDWYDAVKFCNALSTKEGLTPYYTIASNGTTVTIADVTGKGYRLPTEAEWEYAARGGHKEMTHGYKYAGTNVESELSDYAVYGGSSAGVYSTATVGSKLANALGLFDMSGNVWEWCWDWYGNTYPSGFSTGKEDPTGATMGSLRVFRGGSYDDSASYARVADRDGSSGANYRYSTVGFRVVRSQ